jgi:hypothetical protein
VVIAGVENGYGQVATTLNDFFTPGSQPIEPGDPFDPILPSNDCGGCHPSGDDFIPVMNRWQGSMMAHSARDPVFYACLTIANQDVADVGDLCIRCHSPGGWLQGRSVPTDGSALTWQDRDGVNCNFCHRVVDPVYDAPTAPAPDQAILDALAMEGLVPTSIGNGSFVIDPQDNRRGPFDVVTDLGFNPHNAWGQTYVSPFHQESLMCADCHDVSNPVYERQPDGTYTLTPLDEPHPTLDKYDMFPVERTYSEWANSDFAAFGVNMAGLFGGNKLVVSTCQDCHMEDTTSQGCSFGPSRNDMPAHNLSGSSTWVLNSVLDLYPGDNIDPQAIADGIARSVSMLERAATVDLSQVGCYLNVHIINETGHKLPTGYPEGRRMWVNVQFYDSGDVLLAERGYYDSATAELTTGNTRVYEAELGVDAAVAALAGVPQGKGFHFAVNNVVFKDNRIPPRGFTQAAFAAVQAAPVAAEYDDFQYWDDVRYFIPPGTSYAEVRVYFQSTSKEYIEFLRDENTTNLDGQVAYDQWVMHGKSAPVEMSNGTLNFTYHPGGDYDGNLDVDLADYAQFPGCLAGPDVAAAPGCEPFDCDADGDVDLDDFKGFQMAIGL